MLLNDFYTVEATTAPAPNAREARLRLNPDHAVFEGHFPGRPVVPGVCMIQMVTEILTEVLGRKVQLVASSTTRFLNIIDPNIHPIVHLKINWAEDTLSVVVAEAELYFEDQTFFRLKGSFQ